MSEPFPSFELGGQILKPMPAFTYLVHKLQHNNLDDADIKHDIINMLIRVNDLLCRFSR